MRTITAIALALAAWPAVAGDGLAPKVELPAELVNEAFGGGDAHLLEERRLFYVAMTRAKEELVFTSAADYGTPRARKVSRFVVEALDLPFRFLQVTLERGPQVVGRGVLRELGEGFDQLLLPVVEVAQLVEKQIVQRHRCSHCWSPHGYVGAREQSARVPPRGYQTPSCACM